jgi:2-polyprenyl-3-methyl-5-hydroxy-6-metoxy-1,4-benzoquinol methylase
LEEQEHEMPDNLEEYDAPYVYEAEYGQYKGDFDLFLNLIDKGSVLDLACGTGRLAIPLAQKGLEVVGLDASVPMLELARHKSADLPIQWIQGDIRDFQLNQTFDLIIMAGNSFQDQDGEDVRVYGKQQSDSSYQIITYLTQRVLRLISI